MAEDLSNIPEEKLQEIIDIFEPQRENRRACMAEMIRRKNLRLDMQDNQAKASIQWSKIAAVSAILAVILALVQIVVSIREHNDGRSNTSQQTQQSTQSNQQSTRSQANQSSSSSHLLNQNGTK